MSSISQVQGIDQLKNFLANEGVQDTSRFAINIGGYIFNEQVLAIDLPAPTYEFLDINYWQGNPFFKMPVGVKFRESLVVQMLMPENRDGEFFQFLRQYTSANFSLNSAGQFFYGNTAKTAAAFTWQRPYVIPGLRIRVYAYSRTSNTLDKPNIVYVYDNCFLEKILPLRFEAGNSEPQSITMSFFVSSMDAPSR